uniref:Uncharacterized protein n=1 Tax=Arundo donax TaxID=35708 RepID=A0A0A9EHW4_ARUDO
MISTRTKIVLTLITKRKKKTYYEPMQNYSRNCKILFLEKTFEEPRTLYEHIVVLTFHTC